MSATDYARRLRAQDLAADAAEKQANDQAMSACNLIKQIPRVCEEDVLLLLRALEIQIERTCDVQIQPWNDLIGELDYVQSWVTETINARDADIGVMHWRKA